MYYSVQGGTNRYRQTISEALCFAKSYLLPRHKNLEIEVEVTKKMIAEADVIDGDHERHFILRVRKGMNVEDLMTAIFHEFVHIKQAIRKEFPLFEPNCDIPYLERPWEIEAYKLQEDMLLAYKAEKI